MLFSIFLLVMSECPKVHFVALRFIYEDLQMLVAYDSDPVKLSHGALGNS